MIESYSFGKMIIDGIGYSSDLMVFGDTVRTDWRRKKGHELCVSDISAAINEFNPDAIVVGTGKFGVMKLLPETFNFLNSLPAQLIVEKTGLAWHSYNRLSASQRVLGAFHLTC